MTASDNRGYATIDAVFPDGLPNAIYVSDRYGAQVKIASKNKQFCLPHLLRNLQGLIDKHNSTWAVKMQKLIRTIIRLTKNTRITKKQIQEVESALTALLTQRLSKNPKPVRVMCKRLFTNKKWLTTCLYHRKVPPDNNRSERAIRNAKIKTKVSGCFRSWDGAHEFAILRSVIDSAIKRGEHPFDAMVTPFN